MVDRNWAESDRQIVNNPTSEEAFKLGTIHAAYGWPRTPWGHWSEERKEDYRRGYKYYKSHM